MELASRRGILFANLPTRTDSTENANTEDQKKYNQEPRSIKKKAESVPDICRAPERHGKSNSSDWNASDENSLRNVLKNFPRCPVQRIQDGAVETESIHKG